MTKTRRGGRLRLVLIPSVVALLTLGVAAIWVDATGFDQAASSAGSPPRWDARELRLYQFANAKSLLRLARQGHDVIIVKGPATETKLEKAGKLNPDIKLVNYEQAFALSAEEAEYARTRGWLATTCSGQEISPQNFPRAALLDSTIPAARQWRTDLVAQETRALSYDFNYLDTLRPYFPVDFYDGFPCNVSDAAWLEASIVTIDLVQEKTGKAVIANGSGMQTGLQYFDNREVVDRLMATANAVQVEHFGGFRSDLARDIAFVEAIRTAGKDAYVKCRRPSDECRDILAEVQSRGAIYMTVDR